MRQQLDRFVAFSRTREGLAVNVVALLFTTFLVAALAASKSHASTAGGFILALPLSWVVARLLILFARRRWEASTAPATLPFARQRSAGSASATLRRDHNATFWQDSPRGRP